LTRMMFCILKCVWQVMIQPPLFSMHLRHWTWFYCAITTLMQVKCSEWLRRFVGEKGMADTKDSKKLSRGVRVANRDSFRGPHSPSAAEVWIFSMYRYFDIVPIKVATCHATTPVCGGSNLRSLSVEATICSSNMLNLHAVDPHVSRYHLRTQDPIPSEDGP
jgi:hypothetical protein